MKLLLALLLLLLAPSCTSTGAAPVTVYARFDTSWILYDGQVFVSNAAVEGEAAILGKMTGIPIMGPLTLQPGKLIASHKGTGDSFAGDTGVPLPSWAASVFPPGYAEFLGVTFESD